MNKQELIKAIETLDKLYGDKTYIVRDDVLKLVGQLDEPQKIELPKMEIVKSQKPIVPQFVADFITEQKKQVYTLSESIDANMSDRVAEWYWDNSELFARAWLDGYEVEKEKKYTVKVKAYLGQFSGRYYLNNEELTPRFTRSQFTGKGEIPTFTRKELEDAGFGWVFDCLGMEVEEVDG